MRFDLFYELAVPPQLALGEAHVFANALDEAVLGERLGFNGIWLVEHHFTRGYSHSSKPELFLAALAARTTRLRLGFGVIPLPYHHPVHVAERVATLDVLSAGRVELGIGRGFSPAEYAAFGVAMGESRALVDESLAILRRAMSTERIDFHGRHFSLNGVDIVPRPLQQPVPLWTAAVSPETFDWAASEGLGVLVGPFKPWFMVEQDIRRYRAEWRHATPPRIGMTVGILCLPDGKRARALAAPAFEWFYGELLKTVRPVLEGLFPSYERFGELGRFRHLLRFGAHPRLLEFAGMTIAGTPDECIARAARLREAGVTHLLCAVGAGAVPTAIVRESLACISETLLPALAD